MLVMRLRLSLATRDAGSGSRSVPRTANFARAVDEAAMEASLTKLTFLHLFLRFLLS